MSITARSTAPPSVPRLRTAATSRARTLLDGGRWPRTTDPGAEIPGLVLAADRLHGRVTRLVLAADRWGEHPRRLEIEPGRTVRLGHFASQPISLLSTLCDNGGRVDLLVVPPDTEQSHAAPALLLAPEAGRPRHTPQISSVETGSTGHERRAGLAR